MISASELKGVLWKLPRFATPDAVPAVQSIRGR